MVHEDSRPELPEPKALPTPDDEPALTAPFTLEYVYKRSLGPVLGRFFTSLREGRIEGIRTRGGRVLCPPAEYDPDSGEPLSEFVPVGPAGTVMTYAWVNKPRPNHPMDRPFAWALVRLDGADTAMLHIVDAGDESRMAVGLRVRPRFRKEPAGGIRDIVCFELEEKREETKGGGP